MLKKIFISLGILICVPFASWADDPRIEEHNRLTAQLMKLGDEQVEEKNPEAMTILYAMVQERKKNENYTRE